MDFVSAAAAIIAAIISVWGAFRSSRSANEANERLAEALEAANELRAKALPKKTAAWGDAVWKAGDTFTIKNIGNCSAVVSELTCSNENLLGLFRDMTGLPKIIDPGDEVMFMYSASMAGSANPIFVWHNLETPDVVTRTERFAVKGK